MELIVFVLGIISLFLIRHYVLHPLLYRGVQIEGGMSFNRPFLIELCLTIFWASCSLWFCYMEYQLIMEVGLWNAEVLAMLMPIMLTFAYALSQWFDRNSEIQILHNKIQVLGVHLKEPQIIENIQAVYFSQVRSIRLTLSDNATDWAIVVIKENDDEEVINVQGISLGMYRYAIQKALKTHYKVLTKEEVKERKKDA